MKADGYRWLLVSNFGMFNKEFVYLGSDSFSISFFFSKHTWTVYFDKAFIFSMFVVKFHENKWL